MKNLKTILVLAMALFASSCTAQNKEKSKAELAELAQAQALQIAKEFTEALYHGEYEKAKEYGSSVSDVKSGYMDVKDGILVMCQNEEENYCELDSGFVFKKIKMVSESNADSTLTRYRILYHWKAGYLKLDVERTERIEGINYEVITWNFSPSEYVKDLSKVNQYKY